MDSRTAKLALARKKLKDHQEKKNQKDDRPETPLQNVQEHCVSTISHVVPREPVQSTNMYELSETEIKNNTMDYNSIKETPTSESDVNVTEILIMSKRNLEIEVSELKSRLMQLESNHTLAVNNNNILKQKIVYLEKELKNSNDRYVETFEDIKARDHLINELNHTRSSLTDENGNLIEQLEVTKNMLTAKEAENTSLQRHLQNLQNQLDAVHLQLQQLTNGSHSQLSQNNEDIGKSNEMLLQKVASLEQQLIMLQKERDQINSHYEHYVGELNEQLKSAISKNQQLTNELHLLSERENSLVGQISEMEIRLHNLQSNLEYERQRVKNSTYPTELQQNYEDAKIKLQELTKSYDGLQEKYNEIKRQYEDSETKVRELSEAKEECNHDNISISKLSADIASDKVAAQIATEQNRKLKTDLQELEKDFVKMTKDKLELTEKLTAEKYLNRELTLRLADAEEKAKALHTKVMSKDEEMIRLQNVFREMESKFEKITHDQSENGDATENLQTEEVVESGDTQDHANECEHLIETRNEEKCLRIRKEDAMLQLQDRFLKIMGEVADLSDEKHRLEHIIVQLQNETDTICEYVALYQQQRSLLKKRDEERSAQLKIFQAECDSLKNQLEELSNILVKFSRDNELSTYFQDESKHGEMAKVMNLLSKLKSNTLIDPLKKVSQLNDFYPCNCCSGKLIDV